MSTAIREQQLEQRDTNYSAANKPTVFLCCNVRGKLTKAAVLDVRKRSPRQLHFFLQVVELIIAGSGSSGSTNNNNNSNNDDDYDDDIMIKADFIRTNVS